MFLIRLERNPRLQDDHAVGPPLDRDIALQPMDLAKGRFGQHRGCIPTHIASPEISVLCGSLLSFDIDRLSFFEESPDAFVIVFDQQRFCHAILLIIVVPANAGTHTPCRFVVAWSQRPSLNKNRRWLWVPAFAGTTTVLYLGAIRIAPSRRMVSPLSIGFSTICTARLPYSEASPSRAGCGTCAPRLLRASSFSPINSGVRNRPGAMVLTRIFWLARSRAAGSVRPTTPPLEAE